MPDRLRLDLSKRHIGETVHWLTEPMFVTECPTCHEHGVHTSQGFVHVVELHERIGLVITVSCLIGDDSHL